MNVSYDFFPQWQRDEDRDRSAEPDGWRPVGNLALVLTTRRFGVDLIVYPELMLCGYPERPAPEGKLR